MIDCEMDARIVKTCSMGLKEAHVGKTISELQPKFREFATQFGFNVCGEGGEYETAVFDCPLFKKRLNCASSETKKISGDDIAPVCILQIKSIELTDKSEEDHARHA